MKWKREASQTGHCELWGMEKAKVPKGASSPEHEVIPETKIQRPPNHSNQVIGNRQAGRQGKTRSLTALATVDHPLKAETVGKEVWKPLFNVECSNPRQVDLNRGVLNSFGQEGSKKAQPPLNSWAWRAWEMELTKLSAEWDKVGWCIRSMCRWGKALGQEGVALLF